MTGESEEPWFGEVLSGEDIVEGHQLIVGGNSLGGEGFHLHVPAKTELKQELDKVPDKLTALRLGRPHQAQRLQDLGNVFVMRSIDECSRF